MSTQEPPHPLDPNFQLQLPSFEGPLDLLLYLCRKHELDILDLPIAFVTERYLEYLGMMKQLNLDIASEYLVMAAELARIKSKMLLPQTEEEETDEETQDEQDPRADLIQRLLEFQKYKRASEELASRGIAGRDVFYRGVPAPEAEGPAPLAEVSIFKLLDALKRVVERAKADLSVELTAERVSIQQRMSEITEMLRDRRQCTFEALFENVSSTYDIVVTFLAILEMAKNRMLRVYQPDPKSAIQLEYRVIDEDGAEAAEPGEPDSAAPPDGAQPTGEQPAPPEPGEVQGPAPDSAQPGGTDPEQDGSGPQPDEAAGIGEATGGAEPAEATEAAGASEPAPEQAGAPGEELPYTFVGGSQSEPDAGPEFPDPSEFADPDEPGLEHGEGGALDEDGDGGTVAEDRPTAEGVEPGTPQARRGAPEGEEG
jgi:segregation and condensation protein A